MTLLVSPVPHAAPVAVAQEIPVYTPTPTSTPTATPAQQAGVEVTPESTSTNGAQSEPQLERVGSETVLTVQMEARQVSSSCWEYTWDGTAGPFGTWDLIQWGGAPTGGYALADWYADGATFLPWTPEDPALGSPTKATYSWYAFALDPLGSGAQIQVEPTRNTTPVGWYWFIRSENLSNSPAYVQVESPDFSVNGAFIRSNGAGRRLGWDYFRIYKCYDGVPLTATPTNTPRPTNTPIPPTNTPRPTVTPSSTFTPTPTPTSTRTATPTWTPTPCPTNPPWPTPTATPTVDPGGLGTVIAGDATCRHSVSFPVAGVGSQDSCPMPRGPASPEEVESAETLQQWPTCFAIDPQVAAVMRQACGGSFSVQWQVSNGQQIVAKKITCTGGHNPAPEDAGGVFMRALIGLSAAQIAAIIAAATASGAVVIGAVVVGGTIYLLVTYVGTPLANWVYVPSQTLADEWLLAQSSAGMWPAAPLGVRVGPVETQGAAVVVKFYDGGWGGAPRQMYLIDPASRPSGLGVAALLQIQLPDRLVSVLVVQTLLPTDRALIAQPVAMTFPEDGANVLTDNVLENLVMSTLHPESALIIASIANAQGEVRARGNQGDPDSIEIYATVNRGIATIAGLWMHEWRSGYFLFQVPVQNSPAPGLKQLGDMNWWYRQNAVHAWQAWYLSYLQGRVVHPEWALMSRQEGQRRFLEIRAKYGLVRPIAVFWIP